MSYIQTRMSHKINDIPIRAKFMWLYFVLILLPMIIVYLVFFTQLRDEVSLREESVMNQSLERIISDTEYLIDGCLTIARDIAIDQKINELLEEDYIYTSDYFEVYSDILQDQIQRYATSYNNIIKVSVYTDNETVLNGGNVYSVSDKIQLSSWYQSLNNNDSKSSIVYWIEPHPYIMERFDNRISLVRVMDEYAQYEKDKYVRIDIEEKKISQILESVYDVDFVITDDQDRIISTTDSENFNNTGEPTYFDYDNYSQDNKITISHFNPVEGITWYVYAIGPKLTLSGQFNQYANLIGLMFLMSLGLSILLIYIFTNTYTSRIHLLKNHMKKVENAEFITVEGEQGQDEIGSLIRTFNKMTKRINGLVNEVFTYKIKEKDYQLEQVKAELKFLQSQMDPHFLFNTLNAILVVSSRNGYNEITNIIKYLAKTLRYLIEWDNNMIALEKELAFTKMYLEIEKFRFRDKFDYNIYIEEGLESTLVPKLAIQPFIENACKHGLQASKENGLLSIRVYSSNDQVHILIEDNGVGMSKEVYEEVMSNQSDSHIGITNVIKRLEIQYGSNHEIHISSVLDAGTKVLIQVPKNYMEVVKDGYK